MILNEESRTYNRYDFNYEGDDIMSLKNKLFCTFSYKEDLDKTIEKITSNYNILFNKVFVLYVKSNNEYAVTYNIEDGNINNILDNTILLHRKKHFNSLYSINALNTLIKSLNNDQLDKDYQVNWGDYRNSILLTQNNELKILKTKIHNIIEF